MTVSFDPADYWQLRALSLDVEREQALAVLAEARLQQARARRQAYWTALAAKYGIAPEGAYGLMDESCSLVDAPVPTPVG